MLMRKQQLRITCNTCGCRRVKAKTITGRKVTRKICRECYDHDNETIFFTSSAGNWFKLRAMQHCTKSIPNDTSGLIELINLYKQCQSAKGYSCKDGVISCLYDYELCHKDHRIGSEYTGSLTANNLYIGLKEVNRSSNNDLSITNFGNRITEQGLTIDPTNVKEILRQMYDIKLVVSECNLIRKAYGKPKDFVQTSCMDPSELFTASIMRLGYSDIGHLRIPLEMAVEGFETLQDMPSYFAYGFLLQHGDREIDEF
jgi:hypothetical protein